MKASIIADPFNFKKEVIPKQKKICSKCCLNCGDHKDKDINKGN